MSETTIEKVTVARFRASLAGLLIALLISACATIPEDFKQPGVTLLSVTPRAAEGGVLPEFDILLRVTNPNRKALDIAGLSYEFRLAGSKLVEGVASDLPRIEAYGEAEVGLRARADLLSGLGVLSRFLDKPGEPIEFEFEAEIDVGAFYPNVKITRSGLITL